jgi:hypothetical protein
LADLGVFPEIYLPEMRKSVKELRRAGVKAGIASETFCISSKKTNK